MSKLSCYLWIQTTLSWYSTLLLTSPLFLLNPSLRASWCIEIGVSWKITVSLYVRHLSVTAQPVLLLTLTNSRMLLIMAWQMGTTLSPSTTSTSPCAPLSPTSTRFHYVIWYHILAEYNQEELCLQEFWWYIKFSAMVKSTERSRILGPNFKIR